MEKIFITTTLPYANSKPHIGHMFEFLLADAINHSIRLGQLTPNTFMNMGLDCHGTKIWEAAAAKGVDVRDYLEEMRTNWVQFCEAFGIKYDNFYMTSDPEHHRKVQAVWKKFVERGDIYKKAYTGTYCKGCESFKVEKEIVDGKCPDHPTTPLEEVSEENYFFKLEKYKDYLMKWVGSMPRLTPKSKSEELKNLIIESNDLSISRLKSKCPWGVAVPDDSDQVIYVWFDALLNYVFAAGHPENSEGWEVPHKVQIFGPDNLRFQTVIFQAMLAAEGLSPTNNFLCHGTILDASGKKMSKTLGNVVDPMEQLGKWGLDAVRYYALAGLSTTQDSKWDEDELRLKFNSEVCNDFGNFASRVLHLVDTKLEGVVDVEETEKSFFEDIKYRNSLIVDDWGRYEVREALRKTNELVNWGNKYINDTKPWSEKDPAKVKQILTNCWSILWTAFSLYTPVFPHRISDFNNAILERKKMILFTRI